MKISKYGAEAYMIKLNSEELKKIYSILDLGLDHANEYSIKIDENMKGFIYVVGTMAKHAQ